MTKHRSLIVTVFGIIVTFIALQFALPVTVSAQPGETNTIRMYSYYDRGYAFDNSYPEPFTGHSSSFYSELRISKNGAVFSAYCVEFVRP